MKNDRINEFLKDRLASLVEREMVLENGLITIIHVETAPDLKNANVYISVLPQNLSGTALRRLEKNNRYYANNLLKNSRLRKMPRLHWKIDEQEINAIELEKIFTRLKIEKKNNE